MPKNTENLLRVLITKGLMCFCCSVFNTVSYVRLTMLINECIMNTRKKKVTSLHSEAEW